MERAIYVKSESASRQATRFTAVRCNNTQDASNFFGKFSQEGHTILVVMPSRGSCAPYITIPEGVIAVVTKNGEFLGYWKPGIHFCLAWTEAQYLVTQQNIVYDQPVTSCPTSDNIFVEINVSIVFQIQPEHQYVHQLCMNVNELSQMLDAAITERVRTMARQESSKKIYSIRGEKNAKAMKTFLNDIMSTKGITIKSVIITNVKLPQDVANSLQEKTIFQFKNTLERKKQSYELRTINDKEELELLRAMRREERNDELKKAELEFAQKEKEIQKITAMKGRVQAEINQKTKALVSQINAETDVKYNQIVAEAKLIETEILANARAEAAKIVAEADGYFLTKISEVEKTNAALISQAINLEGEAQAKQNKGMKKKRKHLQVMERLNAMDSLAGNKDMVLFGDQGNNLMANIESFKMVYGK